MDAADPGRVIAEILNSCYFVRQYQRPMMKAQRAAAIRALGLACRAAFNSTEDFEPILTAIVDGLAPRDERRF